MKHAIRTFTLPLAATLSLGLAPMAQAEGAASPDEIVTHVQDAAAMLGEKGEAGLAEINAGGDWVWKDTYVFAMDCANKTVVAHPVQPELVGRSLTEIKDSKGNEFLVYMCLAAKAPEGGWVEYWWPLPGMGANQAVRKISYVIQADGTSYQVAAGVYDENISLWELNEGGE